MTAPLTYAVKARRVNSHGSGASCKAASITLDTDLAGREDAFNPAELLLAALSACMLKGIERVAPMLKFEFEASRCRSTASARTCLPAWSVSTTRFGWTPTSRTAGSNCSTRTCGSTARCSTPVAPGTLLSGVLMRASQAG